MLTPYLLIGQVLKPQGVRGEAKLRCDASEPDTCLAWTTLYLKKGEEYTPIGVRFSRVQDGIGYATFEGCSTPEDVEKLRGEDLYIDRAHAAPLAEGEYYLCDLYGCRAVDEQGREIGVLTNVLQYSATDIYVFRTPKGEMMAPALPDVFVHVDVAADRMDVCSPRLAEVAVWQ